MTRLNLAPAPALRGGALAPAPALRGDALAPAPALRGGALGLAALVLALSGACGSYPPPTERMTTSEAAIRAADEVGAGQVPRAALHLKLAQEQTDKARKLMEDGYNERAELTLKRAQADGELALAIAREHQMVEKAQQAHAKLDELRAANAQAASQSPAAAPSSAKGNGK